VGSSGKGEREVGSCGCVRVEVMNKGWQVDCVFGVGIVVPCVVSFF
jgi:hypothetical protein